MAGTVTRLMQNLGLHGLKMERLVLCDVGNATSSKRVYLLSGTGAPSGDYGMQSGATGLYVREDAASVATGLYITVNGGTNWTACDPTALSSLDLNGTELILDADGNTSLTADTDDQIDVKIGGADDFRFLANIFRALAGSSIETDTINETTAANGVDIDGLKIKDGIPVGTNIADPGNAGAIPVTRSGSVAIVTAGAETRTLAAPQTNGQELVLYFRTDGGDCVITVASAINATGNNTITLNDAGDRIVLKAYYTGAALAWTVLANDGASLSTV